MPAKNAPNGAKWGGKMPPAELKTLRESLGLTVQWMADQAGVKLRTAQYWESGRNRVPEDVAAMLESIDHAFEAATTETMAMIQGLNPPPARVVLVRYRTEADLWEFRPDMKPLPATSHAALLSRLRRALWAIGVPSVIEWMEPEAYRAWLNGREDNETRRAAWAAERAE